MNRVNWAKVLPLLFTILVADLMMGIYYLIFVDAFVIMTMVVLAIGAVITLFFNEWTYKGLFSNPMLSVIGASFGLVAGLEAYNDFTWLPEWQITVLVPILIGAVVPWLAMLQKKSHTPNEKTKALVTNAADKTDETASAPNEQNPIVRLFMEFLAFIGGGSLFYGGVTMFIIFGLSLIYWSYVDLTTVMLAVYMVSLGVALIVARSITYRQKSETAEPKKGEPASEPDKKSGEDE